MSDNYPVDKAIERLEKQVGKLTDELLNTKFQHAKLAAKVEQMISKAGTDCDLCEGRGWSINVPSQSMYPCRWCGGKGKVNIAANEV